MRTCDVQITFMQHFSQRGGGVNKIPTRPRRFDKLRISNLLNDKFIKIKLFKKLEDTQSCFDV